MSPRRELSPSASPRSSCWSSCWPSRCSSRSTARTSATAAAPRPPSRRPRCTPSVAPNRPRWRRHVPMLAFALALAILILAAARPQKTVAVPVERASIMLVTDVSGSMQATDVRPTRLVAARAAAQALRGEGAQDGQRRRHGVQQQAARARSRRRATASRSTPALDQLDAARRHRHRRGDHGGDATSCSARARRERQAPAGGDRAALRRRRRPASVDPVAAAQAARKLRIPVYTVALGHRPGHDHRPAARRQGGTETRPVPPDPQSLAEIAQGLGRQDVHRRRRRAAQRRLQAARLAARAPRTRSARSPPASPAAPSSCCSLGAAMSLRWFGRLI